MAESAAELRAEIEKLERRHADNPDARYFVPLANAYRKVGEYDRAERLLRDGLQRHPEYLSAHIVLGRSLYDRGSITEAAAEFRHVLSVDPQNLIALRTLAEIAVAQGDRGEAAHWYRELLLVDPMNEEAQLALPSLEPEPVAEAVTADAEPAAVLPEEEEARDAEEDLRVDAGWWEAVEEIADAHQAEEGGDEAGVPAAVEELDTWGLAEWAAEDGVEEPVSAAPDDEEAEAEGELVTETIAELYARQGFYEQAAGVYRELIRRRGDAPALQERLAALEAILSGEEPAAEEPELTYRAEDWEVGAVDEAEALMEELAPASEEQPALDFAGAQAAPSDAADAFALSFAHGFGGDAEEGADRASEAEFAVADLPSLSPEEGWEPWQAEAEVEALPAAGASVPSIGEYLASLLGWQPGARGVVPAPEAVPEEPSAAQAWEEHSAAELQFAEPEAEIQEEAAPSAPPTAGAEDEPFPWELPIEEAEQGPPAAATPADVAQEDEEPFDIEKLFVDSPAAEAPAEPAPRTEPEPRPASSAAAEEDDDLESFQAWLRSLKR